MKSNSLVPVLAISLMTCLKTEAQVLHDVFTRYAQVPQYSISIYQSESQYPYSGNSSGVIFSLLSFEEVLYETNELADVQDGYYLRYNGATLDGASSWYAVEYDSPFTRTNFDSYHSYYPAMMARGQEWIVCESDVFAFLGF